MEKYFINKEIFIIRLHILYVLSIGLYDCIAVF